MKWKVLILPLLCIAAVAAGYVFAVRGSYHNSVPTPPSILRHTRNTVGLQENSAPVQSNSNIKAQLIASIDSVLQSHPELFNGAKLNSIDVEDGEVSLNFSKEFMQVSEIGDTGESMAQNALLSALSKYPGIVKMSVLVDGRVYQGEHNGDWTDIPVRAVSNSSEDAQ
jgi:hypothetical protein